MYRKVERIYTRRINLPTSWILQFIFMSISVWGQPGNGIVIILITEVSINKYSWRLRKRIISNSTGQVCMFLASVLIRILPRRNRWINQSISLGFPGGSAGKESTCSAGFHLQCRRPRVNPGSGRSPGEGNGNPLQYSFLGSPMVRGA